MVNISRFSACSIIAVTLLLLSAANVCYAENNEEYITQNVSADSCDDRLVDDDEFTAENRAVDKAGLSAVKLSGVIQRYHPELSANAIDTIAYRIIDEYMVNMSHAIKFSDSDRVCVKFVADIEMTSSDMEKLIEEYKDSDAPAEQIADVVKKVEESTTFKPQTLQDKKLLYVRKMVFWNGNETSHYNDFLTGLFSNSEYFYVTEDESIADFVVTPRLTKSEVDEIDRNNHKMQMSMELEVFSLTDNNFAPLQERQNHFILFAGDKDEQKIADELLRKLLTKASKELSRKLDDYSAICLEKLRTGRR
ncbi:MAG: hypothetical protein IJ532_06475 [Alphaproteobacteria bacterium]|nr:hypothetical protein [Alphaproteobacteria bacterium]